jgi:hypothetical protein
MALGEHGDRAEVEVEVVAREDLADRGLVGPGRSQERRDLAEVVLEAGRRDELEQARRLVARVPERVRDGARLAPDPTAWGGDLRVALRELYAWYRETEPMTANVLRDAQTLPALRSIVDGGLGAYLESVRRTLIEPLEVGGRRRERVDAALGAALDFHVWRALAPLGDAEAAELSAGLVELAAQ